MKSFRCRFRLPLSSLCGCGCRIQIRGQRLQTGIGIPKLCETVSAGLYFLLLIFLFLEKCRNLPKSGQLRLLALRLLPKALKRRLLPCKCLICVRKLRSLLLRSLHLIDQPSYTLKVLRQLVSLITCRIQLIRHRIQCLPFCLCRILLIKKLFPVFLQRRLRISPVLQLLFQRCQQGKRLLQPLIFRKLQFQGRSSSIQLGNPCPRPARCLLLLLQLQPLIRQKDPALLIRLQRFPVFLRRLRHCNLTVQPRSLRLQRTALRLLLLQLAGICLQHLPEQHKDLFRRFHAGKHLALPDGSRLLNNGRIHILHVFQNALLIVIAELPCLPSLILQLLLQQIVVLRPENTAQNPLARRRVRKKKLQEIPLCNHRDLHELILVDAKKLCDLRRDILIAAYHPSVGKNNLRPRTLLRKTVSSLHWPLILRISPDAVVLIPAAEGQLHVGVCTRLCIGGAQHIPVTVLIAGFAVQGKNHRIENRCFPCPGISGDQVQSFPSKPVKINGFPPCVGPEGRHHQFHRSHMSSPQILRISFCAVSF